MIAALQRIHVRATVVYVALGVGMWLAVREAGVSPTLAGVVLGFLTPAEPFQRPRAVSDEAHRVADATLDFPPTPDADAPQWLRLAGLSREAVSPLARVEAALHPWTSYVVVPLFALANAGVVLSAAALDGAVERRVALGILVGRLVGKPLGIALACTWRSGSAPRAIRPVAACRCSAWGWPPPSRSRSRCSSPSWRCPAACWMRRSSGSSRLRWSPGSPASSCSARSAGPVRAPPTRSDAG